MLSQEEYVSIICDQLEIIPKDIVIHRITGDAPRDMLIGPMWSLNKWEVLNAIDKEMERRDSWQGCKVVSEKGGKSMIKRPIHLSHDFLAEVLDDESVAVDATMGNGNDTAFLAGLAKKVYAFDVQEQALEKTSQRLSDLGIENAELILDGHENLDHYVTEPIRAAIFNLGYLPSADKECHH